MPDAPGSGPTDPEEIIKAIHNGAEPYAGHLRYPRSGERWIAVVHTIDGPRWVLTMTRGVGLSGDTYDRLAAARVDEGIVHVDGGRFTLVAPEPSARSQFATLVPAP